jgi:hypothetical protein
MAFNIILILLAVVLLFIVIYGVVTRDKDFIGIFLGTFGIGFVVLAAAALFLSAIGNVFSTKTDYVRTETFTIHNNSPLRTDDDGELEIFVLNGAGQIEEKDFYAANVEIEGKKKLEAKYFNEVAPGFTPWPVGSGVDIRITD